MESGIKEINGYEIYPSELGHDINIESAIAVEDEKERTVIINENDKPVQLHFVDFNLSIFIPARFIYSYWGYSGGHMIWFTSFCDFELEYQGGIWVFGYGY